MGKTEFRPEPHHAYVNDKLKRLLNICQYDLLVTLETEMHYDV